MKPSEQQINQWISEYENGLSLRAIARKYGLPKDRIWYHLRGKLALRSKSEQNRKYAIREDFFDQIDSQEKAYMLGFICADGNVKNMKGDTGGYTVSIGLNPIDRPILDVFAKLIYIDAYKIKDDVVKNYKRRTVSPRSTLFICNKGIHSKLIEYGITPAKSLTLKYPDVISGLSEELQKAFVRGYFDGDGCITGTLRKNEKWRKDYQIIFAGNRDFCESMRKVIRSFSGVDTHIRPHQNIVHLVTGGNLQVQKFCDWMFAESTIHLTRKYEKYLELCEQNKQLETKRSIIGLKFKRLTVISKIPRPGNRGGPAYLCRCDCGNETILGSSKLRETQSCGCMKGNRTNHKKKETDSRKLESVSELALAS